VSEVQKCEMIHTLRTENRRTQ